MDNEIKSSVISGPLLHWTKAYILNDCLGKLKHSSRVGFNTIKSIRVAMHNKEITEEEGQETLVQFYDILELNTENIVKTGLLLEKATELVPEGLRSWPTLN